MIYITHANRLKTTEHTLTLLHLHNLIKPIIIYDYAYMIMQLSNVS